MLVAATQQLALLSPTVAPVRPSVAKEDWLTYVVSMKSKSFALAGSRTCGGRTSQACPARIVRWWWQLQGCSLMTFSGYARRV